MGQEFRFRFPMETQRLLCLVVMMFVLIITFQHLELPSGNIFSFISSVHTDQVEENGNLFTDDVLSKSETVSNMTQLNGFNSTDTDHADERAETYGKEKDTDVNNGLVSEASAVSNNSFGTDNHNKESSLQQTQQIFSQENLSYPLENNTSSDVDNHDKVPSFEQLGQPNVHSTVDNVSNSGFNSGSDVREQSILKENSSFSCENTGTSNSSIESIVPILPPADSTPNITFPRNVEPNVVPYVARVDHNASALDKDVKSNMVNHGKSGKLQNNIAAFHDNSSMTTITKEKKKPEMQPSGVMSVSEMNSLLLQSWSSPKFMVFYRTSSLGCF